MLIHLYSIRDRLMGVYLAPFAGRADVEALRQIRATLRDPSMAQSGLVTNPGDYELFCLATLDDESGVVSPISPPKSLGILSSLVES